MTAIKLSLFFLFIIKLMFSNSLPLINSNLLSETDLNSKSIEFSFTLPNNNVVKVNISLVLMKESEPLQYIDNDKQIDYLFNEYNEKTTTSTTSQSTITTTPAVSLSVTTEGIKPK